MNQTISEKITECVARLASHTQLPLEVNVQTGDFLTVTIQAPTEGHLFIGKNGQNLQALEHIMRIMVARHTGSTQGVLVDVNDYRKARTVELTELAQKAAHTVRATGKPEALPPMSALERRIVHTELASHRDVATESIGQEPQRRIVIRPI